MDIFKVIGIGLVGAVISLLLKHTKSDFSALVVVATGVIILILILSELTDVILAFNDIVEKTGVSSALYGALLKIVGIGYITEYSANICSDFGADSIGKKIQFAGKVSIFIMALPIVTALIEVITALV